MPKWRWLAIGGVSLLFGLAGTPAVADTKQADLATVLAALKVAPQPADYVVMVDTSKSMAQNGNYGRVTAAVAGLVNSLAPTDRLSVVTFDASAVVRFDAEVGTDHAAALAALPPSPQGLNSDIGVGIDKGLAQLERDTTRKVAAIVLITDGKISTAKTSSYRVLGEGGWPGLRDRATAISSNRQIAAYTIPLASGSDAKVLNTVFAQVVEVSADEIAPRLSSIQSDLMAVQARQVLGGDPEGRIEVSWNPSAVTLPATGGSTKVAVTLHSTMVHLPIELTGLAVSAPGQPLSASGFPAALSLAPGESLTLPVELTSTGSVSSQLSLSASIASPWKKVLSDELGVVLTPQLSGTATLSPESAISFRLITPVLIGVLGVAAVVLLLLLARFVSAPRLVGSLTVHDKGGRLVDELLLTGRKVFFEVGAAQSRPLKGSVRGSRKKLGQGDASIPGVELRAVVNGTKVRIPLWDATATQAGAYVLTYSSLRSRLLQRINN